MTVRWLAHALSDLIDIQAHIAEDDPVAARAVRLKIDAVVQLLGEQPLLGRRGRASGTRELVIPGTPYVVAYKVIDGHPTILAVLHGARRWPDRF
jgi:toxin ParE1/3/4